MGRWSVRAAEEAGIDVPRRRHRHPQQGSRLERLLLVQIGMAGLPEPEREVRFSEERRFRADFLWRSPPLIVEVQGGTRWGRSRHSRGRGFDSDCEKAAHAALCGYYLVPVSGDMVRDGRALALVERLLSDGPRARKE